MQQNYNVIAKGEYAYKQTSDFLHVERFLIVRKRGRRWLLLDCNNLSEAALTGLKLSIEQFDTRGNAIGERIAEIKKIAFKQGKFILKRAVALENGCVDVRVNVLCAEYGNISYRLGCEGTYTVFERPTKWKKLTKQEIVDKTGETGRTQVFRRFKPPVIFSIVAVVITILSCIIGFVHISNFSAEGDEFFLSNIRYRYAGDSREDGAPVYVVGAIGAGRQTLYIPNEVEGHPVEKVEAEAFLNDSVLRKLTVAKGVAIENSAFSLCDNLREVVLEGNNEVGFRAFYSCERLQNVTINEASVIGYEAFCSCDMRSLQINGCADGYDTAEIGVRAFAACGSAIDTISIDAYVDYTSTTNILQGSRAKNVYLKNYNYQTYETTSDKPLAKLFGGTLSDVETVEIGYIDRIPDSFVYSAYQLKSVKVHHLSDTTIGDSAFYNCNNLSDVSLPLAITSVGKSAFEGTAITSFNASSLRSIGDSAFSSCENLTDVQFGNNTKLTDLPYGAFSRCTSLQSLTLPSGVKTIGDYAFGYCENLETFVLPSSVASIGDTAFVDCYRLHEVHNLSSLPIMVGSSACGEIARNAIAVYSDTQSMLSKRENSGFVFKSANGFDWWLTDYTGEEVSVTLDAKANISSYRVCRYAFDRENTFLRTIKLTSAVSEWKDETFVHIPNLTTVVLQSGVCTLPSYTFRFCYNLCKVVLPAQFNVSITDTTFGDSYSVQYYYEGTRTVWQNRKYSLPDEYSKISYYTSCIHNSDEWNYVNGSVNTQPSDFESITIVSPTCTTCGWGKDRCTECGYTTDLYQISALGHDYNEDHECVRCGYVYNLAVNKDTLKKCNDFVTLTNDKNNAFDVFDRTSSFLYAPSGKISNATFQIEAKKDIIITMYAYASQDASFTIKGGGTTKRIGNKYQYCSFTLQAGEKLTITYNNTRSDSSYSAYICNIAISSANEP